MGDTELTKALAKSNARVKELEAQLKRINGGTFDELGGFQDGLFRWIGPVGQTKHRERVERDKVLVWWINKEIEQHMGNV